MTKQSYSERLSLGILQH